MNRIELGLVLATATFFAGIVAGRQSVVGPALQRPPSQPAVQVPRNRDELAKLVESMSADLKTMNTCEANLYAALKAMAADGEKFAGQTEQLAELAQGAGAPAALKAAGKSMSEASAKFRHRMNQQLAGVQVDIRKYGASSNLLKMKHDTAKNSVANVR
jgi:hypothetical protein